MLVTSIFSFFHNVFYPSQLILSSANALNMDQCNILSFAKGFNSLLEHDSNITSLLRAKEKDYWLQKEITYLKGI